MITLFVLLCLSSATRGVRFMERKALAKQVIVRWTVRTNGYELDKNWNWCIVEDEAKVVRDIYNRFVSGITASQISRDLTKEGIRTMKNKPSWGAQTINSILLNINFTRDLLYNKYNYK